MTVTIPTSEAQYGYVVGRVIRALGDSADADDKPDAVAATGKITFTPKATLGRTTDYSAFIVREKLDAPLDALGNLVRYEGATPAGIALTVGAYKVEFALASGSIPSFEIEVTAGHTQAAPLDLVTAAPYVPPIGVTVQTMLVPADAVVGQVLGWSASGLDWVDMAAATGGVSSVAGRTGAVVLSVADLTDAASLATDTELTSGLAGKANSSHTHTIANVTGLQGALDGKQPAGSYAPATHSHTSSNISDFTEATQDIVGTMVTGAGGTYNDAAGTITLPSGGGSSTITADDTPAAPAEGASASYLVTSAVSWPAGLVWSTDPDGGAAPTITGTALVSFFTVGGVPRAILGATFPALPGADATPPTVGTMAASAITTSGFTLTVSGASDAGGLHAQPYAFTTDGGTTWSAYQASNVLAVTGKAAGTGYSCNWRVRDAAGNVSTGTAQTVTTTAAVTVLASDDFNRANSTTGLGVATTGQTWQQIGTGIVGIIDNRAYRATSNAFAVIDVGQVDMKVSHKVVAGGDYFSGPSARVTADGQDYYWIDTGAGGGALARIQCTIAGAQQSPAGTSAFPTATEDVLALSCKENGAGGTVLTLFINGVEKQSITDTRSNRPMGTRAGIRPFNNGKIRVDDFLVESS